MSRASVVRMLRFLEESVWTVDLTVEIRRQERASCENNKRIQSG